MSEEEGVVAAEPEQVASAPAAGETSSHSAAASAQDGSDVADVEEHAAAEAVPTESDTSATHDSSGEGTASAVESSLTAEQRAVERASDDTTASAEGSTHAAPPRHELAEPSPSLSMDSLLRLFQSEFFDEWLAVYYLHKKFTVDGVQAYICNQLYRMDPSKIEFYLPQLCNLVASAVAKEKPPLHLLLEDLSMRSIHFGLKVIWQLTAMLDEIKEQGYLSTSPRYIRVSSLLEDCEKALVNGRSSLSIPDAASVASVSATSLHETLQQGNENLPKATLDALAVTHVRHELAKYVTEEERFIASLVEHGEGLRKLPRAERAPALSKFLDDLNKRLPNMKVYLPMCSGSDTVRHVMRIPFECTSILQSRDRAPFILYAEVADGEGTCDRPSLLSLPPAGAHVAGFSGPSKVLTVTMPIAQEEDSIGLALRHVITPFGIEVRQVIENTPADREGTIRPGDYVIRVNGISLLAGDSTLRGAAETMREACEGDMIVIEVRRFFSDGSGSENGAVAWAEAEMAASTALQGDERGSESDGAASSSAAAAAGVVPPAATDDRVAVAAESDDFCSASGREMLDEAFGLSLADRRELMRKSSPLRSVAHWDIVPMIVKSGDGIRQEQLANQLLRQFHDIFAAEGLPLWVKPIDIVAVTGTGGLMEVITDAVSLHALKKNAPPERATLRQFFEAAYGPPETPSFEKARRNFIDSLAGYSLFCYIIQVKDRHNGNILLDRIGHVIHIDYGFMLSNSPGFNMNFESAPFKLSEDFVALLDGVDSPHFTRFVSLMIHGFLALRKHHERIVQLVSMSMEGSSFPCFEGGPSLLDALVARFCVSLTDDKVADHVLSLIHSSLNNFRTTAYDRFQNFSNGILS